LVVDTKNWWNWNKLILAATRRWATELSTFAASLDRDGRFRFGNQWDRRPVVLPKGLRCAWMFKKACQAGFDLRQLLVENNHGLMLFPYWVNASDYKETNESWRK
jgi:hypothetical protein